MFHHQSKRGFATACSGPDEGLEIDTLPCFFHAQKTTALHKLGAALTTKSINLTCEIHASRTELLCTDQPLQNLQPVLFDAKYIPGTK